MGAGKSDAFYQKRVPKGAPDWVRTARIAFPSGRSADEVCPTEVAVIAWAANLGTLTFHPWPVRKGDVDHPDELRIDLDPQPGTDFSDAVRVALGPARDLLAELGYTGYVKTSGKGGVHIYVRIEPRWTFTEVRRAALAFGREVERRAPAEVTTRWWKEERGEQVFIDFNQNARDRTIASAYSVRPAPHAPVSAPVTWDELADADPHDFTIATMRPGSPRSATSTRPSTRSPSPWRASWSWPTATRRTTASATCRTRRTTRRCPASPSASSPARTPTTSREYPPPRLA